MKLKLLLLPILCTTLAFAKPTKKAASFPEIGLMMRAYNQGDHILFRFYIKNTGDETLTNIYITEAPGTLPMNYQFSPIASLAPGQELTELYGTKNWTSCLDVSQTIVHATTAAGTEITDLSSNPDYYEGFVGTYYNDNATQTPYSTLPPPSTQSGNYHDQNGNSIVDVGDVILYFYSTFTSTFYDDNATITGGSWISNGNGSSYQATGIHYLTQADITAGYVYNNTTANFVVGYPGGPCYLNYPVVFEDSTPCLCPNPNNALVVTALVPTLPNQISGNVKFNNNNDNCITGVSFPNRRVSAIYGTNEYSSFTDLSGDYHILIPNYNTYTASALTNLGPNFSSSPVSVTVASSGSGVIYPNNNFCISSAGSYPDLSVSMYNINQAMPGNVATYRIYYQNRGNTVLSGSIQLTFDNGRLAFNTASSIPSSATSGTINWNYTNLLPYEARYIDLSLNVFTPPTVNAGDYVNFIVSGTPIVGDNHPSDNTFNWNQIVRSSFDPNDKTVIEGASISPAQTTDYLHYVTRFQNTGTADATTVVIKEDLDPKLDWSTFEPIASSHTSNVQIKYGSQVTYTFSNINLPSQSANEPASHGWIAYQIKPKSNVAPGDTMSSNSNIYFDYNYPIGTNTVSTVVSALSATDFIKSNFLVYPNPAKNYITIQAKDSIESTYEIVDINGKVVLNGVTQSMQPINIAPLQNGFYFLTLKTNQGKANYKLIKN